MQWVGIECKSVCSGEASYHMTTWWLDENLMGLYGWVWRSTWIEYKAAVCGTTHGLLGCVRCATVRLGLVLRAQCSPRGEAGRRKEGAAQGYAAPWSSWLKDVSVLLFLCVSCGVLCAYPALFLCVIKRSRHFRKDEWSEQRFGGQSWSSKEA